MTNNFRFEKVLKISLSNKQQFSLFFSREKKKHKIDLFIKISFFYDGLMHILSRTEKKLRLILIYLFNLLSASLWR